MPALVGDSDVTVMPGAAVIVRRNPPRNAWSSTSDVIGVVDATEQSMLIPPSANAHTAVVLTEWRSSDVSDLSVTGGSGTEYPHPEINFVPGFTSPMDGFCE